MFSAGRYGDDDGQDDYSTVATGGVGGVETTSSSSASSLQALAQTVNTYNIDLAIEAGMQHLQNILDANNHGIPFFHVWAMTRSQTQSYGDPQTYRTLPAHMAFERHLVSNAAGRATYALLLGAEATGTQINAQVLDTFQELVFKSLHKPRNGNWNDPNPANQMVTGLAADPRYYGSQQFDLTFLFNMGAGLRGMLGLATIADDAQEAQPGYLWSSQHVFEVSVYNIRKYYVYGGGEIGGQRTYNWETFRYQLGLEGGAAWTNNINTEMDPDWSDLWKTWSNPFLIHDLVKYYEATGHQPSLELAKELRDLTFYRSFPLNPSQVPINSFSHMFEVTAEMNAYSRLALVLGDADMMERVRVRYEALRGVGFNSTGWVPEFLHRNSDVGEVNNTAELIETALNFAEWGWTEYYEDVERFTRGHVLPSQLLDTSFVVPNFNPANDGQHHFEQRVYGAFGFPAPYGHVATRNPAATGAYHVDITAGAVATLAVIKDAIHRLHNGVHEINLLFDLNNSQIRITSPYPDGDRVTITTKVAGDVRLRLPNWADRSAIAASLTQQGLQYEITSDHVLIRQPQVGTPFYVAMPLAVVRTTDVVNGRSITIDWRGDSVIAMSGMNTPLPFFASPSSSPPPSPNTPTNAPPVVNAGPDRTVVLGSALSLAGSASDDGLPDVPGTLSVGWTKVSGPGTVTFANANALNTTVQFSALGQYVLRLSASDGQLSRYDDVVITVEDPVQPVTIAFQDGVFPTVQYAGTRDTTIASTAPASGHGATSSITVDGHPDMAALMAWDVSAIPIGSTVVSAAIELYVTDPSKQSYELYALNRAWEELAATWQQFAPGQSWATYGASGGADAGTTVLGSLTLPTYGFQQIALNQAGLDLIQAWVNDSSGNNGLILKDYVSADDAANFSSRETSTATQRPKLVITYRPDPGSGGGDPGGNDPDPPPVNQPPQVNAGADQSVQLPGSITLHGTVTDDGLPATPGAVGTAWSKVSGPGTVTFGNAGNRNTTASFSAPGTYVLRLAANDGQYQAYDELTVTVLAAPVNQPPQVNAGPNQTIRLPDSVSLAGTVADDGLPATPGAVSTTWSKVSGPGTVTFANAANRNTTASFSAAGTYVLRLTANDGQLQTFDQITVTVNPAPVHHPPPTVSAGPDMEIKIGFPAYLSGGLTFSTSPRPVTTLWTLTLGPGPVHFSNPNSLHTAAYFEKTGTYVIRLTVYDGEFIVFDEVTVSVGPKSKGRRK